MDWDVLGFIIISFQLLDLLIFRLQLLLQLYYNPDLYIQLAFESLQVMIDPLHLQQCRLLQLLLGHKHGVCRLDSLLSGGVLEGLSEGVVEGGEFMLELTVGLLPLLEDLLQLLILTLQLLHLHLALLLLRVLL